MLRRKDSFEDYREHAVIEAVGRCPATCTVQTRGLAGSSAEQKALMAARLAHTAVALLWETPSGALSGINLLYDGDVHQRRYMTFGSGGRYGSSSSLGRLAGGPPPTADWEEYWADAQRMISQVGEALHAYVDPAHAVGRPVVLNALLLALWWFHDACREQSPLMATVKFAASMDVLADGRRRRGISRFIEARFRIAPDGALTRGGRTAYDVLGEIYDYARSRTIHGSNEKLSHDWSETRALAETLARLCLHLACDWMNDNLSSDDLAAMQVR